MINTRILLLFFLILGSTAVGFGQADTTASRYNGLALDVFPLLNQIFSDDGSSSLFQLTYLWGRDKRRFELTMSPQYRKTNSDNETSDAEIIGSSIAFFHGKHFDIGNRWRGNWGMSYCYHLNVQTSKSSGFDFGSDFKIKTTSHKAGLGPSTDVWLSSIGCHSHQK